MRIDTVLDLQGKRIALLGGSVQEQGLRAMLAVSRFDMDLLAEQGVRVAIDDFGTGYSSVGELKRLKLDKLKIAPSFVRSVSESPDARAVVCAIIHLARNLGLRTVAEGAETAEQLDLLRRMAGSPNPA